jgi:hypothetical protein
MTMTKKSAGKVTNNKNANEPDVDRKDDGLHEPRKRLLARMAGNIAAGIISDPSESTVSAEGIAGVAVDVAEAILKKIGL